MTPALTRPTIMTVVSEELCTMAVVTVPMPTPERRLATVFRRLLLISARSAAAMRSARSSSESPERSSGRNAVLSFGLRWKKSFSRVAASFSMLSESSLTPMRKAPSPAMS